MDIKTPDLSLTGFKPRVDEELRTIFATASAKAATIDHHYLELLGVMESQLLRSGKRVRPYLTYLAYIGCGGKNSPAIITAAASQELFHHYLLIHDDIIDRDLTRHGGPNVAGTYLQRLVQTGLSRANAEHYSSSYALLAGDTACALGFQALLAAQFEPARTLAAMQCIQHMLFEILGGELMDIQTALPGSGRASITQLLKICHYKTATYSFEAPLQLGALLAGAKPGLQEQLLAFATPLGVAFQLTDDLLGVYGDEAMLGKPVLSDLHEGKQTLLMHYTMTQASPAEVQVLQRIWGNRQAGPAELETIRTLLRDAGAEAKVTAQARNYLDQSLVALKDVALDPAVKVHLAELAHFCVDRQY